MASAGTEQHYEYDANGLLVRSTMNSQASSSTTLLTYRGCKLASRTTSDSAGRTTETYDDEGGVTGMTSNGGDARLGADGKFQVAQTLELPDGTKLPVSTSAVAP